jgi:hypothetical protein
LDSFRRLIDSIEHIRAVLNEKEEDFSQKKIKNFCNLLRETRLSEEVSKCKFLFILINIIFVVVQIKALINESYKSVTESITKFLDSDLKQIKESKKNFEKITNELDLIYNKNADTPKTKPSQCDEVEKSLIGIKKSYGHSSLEYIRNINRFYLVRSHSVLDTVIN